MNSLGAFLLLDLPLTSMTPQIQALIAQQSAASLFKATPVGLTGATPMIQTPIGVGPAATSQVPSLLSLPSHQINLMIDPTKLLTNMGFNMPQTCVGFIPPPPSTPQTTSQTSLISPSCSGASLSSSGSGMSIDVSVPPPGFPNISRYDSATGSNLFYIHVK